MIQVNTNYQKLPGSYLFSEIARRVAAQSEACLLYTSYTTAA